MQHNTQSSFQADCNMCIVAQNSYYTFIYVRIYIHELHKIQQKCKYLYIILYTLSTIVKSHRPTLWAPTSPPQTSAQFWMFCTLSIQRLQLLLILFWQLCIFFEQQFCTYISHVVVRVMFCSTLYCAHLTSAPPPANSFIPSLFNLYPHYPPTVFLIISNKIVCIPLVRSSKNPTSWKQNEIGMFFSRGDLGRIF